jgi:TolB-like protein/Tfp pilus assembly protein PilF
MKEHRKLAAIMFTDIVGYSAMMSKDEKQAMNALEKNRDIHKTAIAIFNGEYIKEIGDGNLAIFQSSFDAVNCAIEIHKACCKESGFQIRIGIHIGDIIMKEGDVFGDGVNIASRIEASGEPGGIYISERVNEDIENKTEIKTKFIGEKTLKNISHPVRIFSIRIGKQETILSKPIIKEPGKTKEKSIAVLPFINMSPDPEQEYFCEGMAEELINALTKIKNLNVVARTSSFAFKGEKTDIREIGRKLNVGILVEGSIRKAGNRLRITAQLIKVEDGYHLWSERYDRNMADVFAIQEEITLKIVDRLKTSLNLQVKLPKERHPDNFTAYDLYLRGRYYINKFLPEYTHQAIEYYKKAIEEDPRFTLAYTSLAEAYTLLSTGFDILPTKDAMPMAREAALKALEFDPNLAEAYVSLGLVSLFYDFNRKSTIENFKKALELNPNSMSAHLWIEFYWSFMEGKFDKSMATLQRAQELDPLNLLIKIRIGYVYIYKRDFDSAVNFFEKLLDSETHFPMGHHCLMEAYAQKKMYKKALAEGEKMLAKGAQTVANIGILGLYYALAGEKDKANNILSDLIERSKNGYVSSFWVGTIYHGLGETDSAFEWFEKAYNDRDGNLIYITTPPTFDSLRSDPRFKQLLIKMGLENLLAKELKS